ncbi:MAG: formylglycine-generating enzyme family protein, partial [Rhodobacteraceae bacterium]|nr:formylglycine-generating enzyme family protein [Paracoccaceae bacterium]
MVALLTDGNGLDHALSATLERRYVEQLLRQLRLWPHLVFVDFGRDGRLSRLLRPYGLKAILPQELAAWLGGQETGGQASFTAPKQLQGDLRIWAAACCLSPDPLDPDSAQRLRERLGLQAETWQIRALQADADDAGLGWSAERRHTLVNWLLRCAPADEHGLPGEDTPAARAIRWWQGRYRVASGQQGRRQNRLLPWNRTPAQRRWRIELELLELVLDPVRATPRLQALAASDAELREEIRERLGELRSADQLDPNWTPETRIQAPREAVFLTWELGTLPSGIQDSLVAMGFGGGEIRGRRKGLRPAPRLSLSLGLLAGLAIAAGGSALYQGLNPPAIQLQSADPLMDRSAPRSQTLRLVDNKRGRLALGHAKEVVTRQVPPGSRVRINWKWEGSEAGRNNPVRLGLVGSDALVFRAGVLAQPIRPCVKGWPARSLALVQASPEEVTARRLAIRLLDSGTADQVLIGNGSPKELKAFLGDDPLLNDSTRWLSIQPHQAVAPTLPAGMPGPLVAWAAVSADFQELARWLNFPGLRKLEAAPVRVLMRRGAMPWHGGPEQQENHKRTGIVWVRACPGTFTMGSDRKVDGDEAPVHTVILTAFDIARTETTNGQYRLFRPEHEPKKDGRLPAVNVTWDEARKFCRWAGS